jgi:aryl-alcohol dehydrogenase-like predicted oxidoreductase
VFLATKLFPVLPLAPVVELRAVASASRLGTRRIDLYQVHWPNPLVSDGTSMRGHEHAAARRAGRGSRRKRLIVNVAIVVVFAAFYVRFLKRA